MFTEPPLAVIFSKLPELVGHIQVLEGRPTTGQRHDALRSVLELVCRDLGEFISERYAQLHEAAVAKLPKSTQTKQWRKLRKKNDRHVVDGRQTCHRIGREPLTLRERRTPGLIARKAVTVTLVIGGLVGLEQDIGGFIKDVEAFTKTVIHGLDRLINDDEFVVPLPSPEILPPVHEQPVARPSEEPGVAEPPTPAQPPRDDGPRTLPKVRPREPHDVLPRPADLDKPALPEPTKKRMLPEPSKPVDEPPGLEGPWLDGPARWP